MWHQEAGKIRVYKSTSSFKEIYRYIFLLFSLFSFTDTSSPWETPLVCPVVLESKQIRSQTRAEGCPPALQDMTGAATVLPSWGHSSSPTLQEPSSALPTAGQQRGQERTKMTLKHCPPSAASCQYWKDVWGFPLVFKNIHTRMWRWTDMHTDTRGCTCSSVHTQAHTQAHIQYQIGKPTSS